ncbi:MAG: glycosyltransferase [Planctomycetota bacterium]
MTGTDDAAAAVSGDIDPPGHLRRGWWRASLTVGERVLLVAVMLLAPVQLFLVEAAGSQLSLWFLAAVVLTLLQILRPCDTLRTVWNSPCRWLVALSLLCALALVWSSDRVMGLRWIAQMLVFVGVFLAAARHPRTALIGLGGCLLVSLFPAWLMLWYREDRGAVLEWLSPERRALFSSSNYLLEYFGPNWHERMGGGVLFINENRGASAMGQAGLLAVALFGLSLRWRWCWLGCAAAAVAWGCFRAAQVPTVTAAHGLLAMATALSGLFVLWFAIRAVVGVRARWAVPLLIFASALAYGVLVWCDFGWFDIMERRAHAPRQVEERLRLWRFARDHAFWQAPIRGLGFGNWAPVLDAGLDAGMVAKVVRSRPPHNSLIHIWSWAGIPALLCALAFIGSTFTLLVRAYALADARVRWFVAFVALAFLWLFVHGLFTNYGLVGDRHMQSPLAAALALAWVLALRQPQRRMPGGDSAAIAASGATADDEAPTVAVYRHRLFKASEPFIADQANALRRWRPLFVGRRKAADSPAGHRVVVAAWGRCGRLWHAVVRSPLPVLRAMRGLQRPALIHAHFGPEGVYALPLASFLRVPLVVTFHGFDAALTRRRLVRSRSIAWIRYALWRWWLFRRAAALIAVSESVRERLIALGAPPRKVVRHYIGIDVDAVPVRASLPETPTVVHVARLQPVKGTRDLIDAVARVRAAGMDCRLVIVGDGPLRSELEHRAAPLGGAVEFAGMLPHTAVLERIRASSLLCLPSRDTGDGAREGLGMVLLEAAASGVPCIGTRHGGIPEAIDDGETGLLVPEGDVAALAVALNDLLCDAQRNAAMGQAGRAMVADRFAIDRQAAALEALYAGAVAGRWAAQSSE